MLFGDRLVWNDRAQDCFMLFDYSVSHQQPGCEDWTNIFSAKDQTNMSITKHIVFFTF